MHAATRRPREIRARDKRGLAHAMQDRAGAGRRSAPPPQSAQALGIPAAVLDARQTAALDPAVSMDIAGAVYFERDCHLDPARYVATLEKRLRAARVPNLIYDAEVTGWQRDGERITAVHTTRGEIAADAFVLASGAWSPALVADLGLKLPMQAGKGYKALLFPTPLPNAAAACARSIHRGARRSHADGQGGPALSAERWRSTGHERAASTNVARCRNPVRAMPEYFPHFSCRTLRAACSRGAACGPVRQMACRISGARDAAGRILRGRHRARHDGDSLEPRAGNR